jgi:hypothetical protein
MELSIRSIRCRNTSSTLCARSIVVPPTSSAALPHNTLDQGSPRLGIRVRVSLSQRSQRQNSAFDPTRWLVNCCRLYVSVRDRGSIPLGCGLYPQTPLLVAGCIPVQRTHTPVVMSTTWVAEQALLFLSLKSLRDEICRIQETLVHSHVPMQLCFIGRRINAVTRQSQQHISSCLLRRCFA